MIRLPSFSAAVLLLAVLGSSGCAYFTNRSTARSAVSPRPITFALAVTIQGGLQPSPAQWAVIQAKFAQELAVAGHVLVTNLALADRILRVDFRPSLDDPEGSGHVVILSVRPNPLRELTLVPTPSLAYTTRYPSSFGYNRSFANSFSAFPGSSYYNSYYGYGNAYYDGYSYSTPTLNPRKPAPTPPVKHPDPTHRHHPDPDHRRPPGPDHRCPPLLAVAPPAAAAEPVAYPPSDGRRPRFVDETRRSDGDRTFARRERDNRTERTYPRSESGTASAEPSRSWVSRLLHRSESSGTSSDGSRSRTERSTSGGERTYSRSDRGSSGSERTYSRSDSGYSRSDSSSSHSSSSSSSSSYSPAPSYSPPSYSSSDSSSYSSSSSASSSSSSSSSGGASSGREATLNTIER